MKTWTTIEKSDWGDGPWQHEPDKAQWVDETTGLDCLIVRNPGGALCGYVGVPPEHPWHGESYGYHDGDPDSQVTVHGGLTYSDSCMKSDDPAKGICHVPEPGRPDDVWWFGFDCAHAGDLCPRHAASDALRGWSPMGGETYRAFEYVAGEVTSLASQVAEVSA